ncbi:hypothetical protein VTJ49DRAFT_3589 [Mycothermus thermophilus]|uniref:Polyketide synthase n=1 Tax=Humicola insolens TaxID=85995 RepID=A0ABR3VM33_HUMIN
MPYKPPLSEPIAIVGTGCRFAGHATTVSRLWELLTNPTDLSREVPPERFNIRAFYHSDGEYHGATNSSKAYFLDQDHRVFDSSFFGISPKEAEAIDPQQRMTLEVVYEALESAGYSLHRYAVSNVGVFAGLMTGDYETLTQRDELNTSQYYATGNARCILSNRISYFFNWRGPSLTVDTACSSSLVALHQAVLSLRAGECTMACVAGANLLLTPEQFIAESKLHMLSPTGHCRMWDASADGYARGEGIAAILVKTLKQALADGDHIEAIIRETAVNSDGHTRGITMPNWEAQSRLIQETYRRAGLNARDPDDRCQYFEAHGTGTAVGDPNEARAIEDAFFKGDDQGVRKSSHPPRRMLVGSIKTVIGHTEGAAGLAGLLKVVESMRHDTIPPNLHLDKLSPAVQPFYSKLMVPTEVLPWPQPPAGQPKRGSVNSFGFGGTNAHAIIEEYVPKIHSRLAGSASPTLNGRLPASGPKLPSPNHRVMLPLLLSAPSRTSLVSVIKTYRDYLALHSEESFAELAWHAHARRTAFRYRVAVTSLSKSGIIDKLDSILAEAKASSTPNIGSRVRSGNGKLRILGIFRGQGAQWATMSRGLLRSSRVFADSIRYLNMILKTCPDPPSWSLESEILANEGKSHVDEASISQPLCTAIQIALVDLLRYMGIGFAAVVGHSSGEMAAAYAAGRLSARDAILVAHYRGMSVRIPCGANGKPGGMLAAGLTKEEAVKLCRTKRYFGRLWVAAVNAPCNVTLSGDVDAIQEVSAELNDQNKFARVLKIDKAYHSPHMEDASVKYLEKLTACNIRSEGGNGTDWVSSVYGWGEPSMAELSARYWKDNMVNPVLFCDAVGTAVKMLGPFDCAIEVGPHPALKGPVTQTMKHRGIEAVPYTGLLDRTMEDREAFATFLGWMWTRFGASGDNDHILRFVMGSREPELINTRLPDAPRYPWDHSQIFYRESRIARQYHFKTDKPHELLGVRTRDDNKHQLRWRNILKFERIPWVGHHSFQGHALLPASAYLVMTLDAAKVALAGRHAAVIELRDLKFSSGIVIEPDTPGVEVLFDLTIRQDAKEALKASFTLCSTVADGRTDMKRNFSGTLSILLGEPSETALPSRPTVQAETLPASSEAFYRMMEGTGLAYTGPFNALQTLRRRYSFATGTVRRRHDDDTMALDISPATLDACFQTAFVTVSSPGDNAIWTSFLPVEMQYVRFNLAALERKKSAEDTLTVDAYLTSSTPATEHGSASFTADIDVFDGNGNMEIQVQGLTVASIGSIKPENDYELYLTTKFDLDPDDKIVCADFERMKATNHVLVESCERVAAFYLEKDPNEPISTPWPDETEESIRQFIHSSPYFSMLEHIRDLIQTRSDHFERKVPGIMTSAHQLVALQHHISRIARQISHKYPRMHVLGLADPALGLTEHILTGLGESFASYRIGTDPESNLDCRLPTSRAVRRKIVTEKVNMYHTDTDCDWYDLIILTTSLIPPFHRDHVLSAVRRMTRPGGFLVLVDVSKSGLSERMQNVHDLPGGSASWPALLDAAGFKHAVVNSHQTFPGGFEVVVRQAESFKKRTLLHPFAYHDSEEEKLTNGLLIIGGGAGADSSPTARLVAGVRRVLGPRCDGHVCTASSLDAIEDVEFLSQFSAAIVLQDLDEPVLAGMTQQRMGVLRTLFRPQMTILWVTRGARYVNPDHAASFGFVRTIVAETPGLVMQMLDLGPPEDGVMDVGAAVEAVTEGFARLAMHRMVHGEEGDADIAPLWLIEPEVYVEKGRRYVARVVPWKEANERVNAARRAVKKTVNTLEKVVELVPAQETGGTPGRYDVEVKDLDALPPGPGLRRMKVEYSTAGAFEICGALSYLVAGRDIDTGKAYVALVERLGSFVILPEKWSAPIDTVEVDTSAVLACLARYIAAIGIENSVTHRHVLLVGSDPAFSDAFAEVLDWSGVPLTVCSTDESVCKATLGAVYLHPGAALRDVRALYPIGGSPWVIDMLPRGSKVSEMLVQTLPSDGRYTKFSNLLTSLLLRLTTPLFKQVVECAVAKVTLHSDVNVPVTTVPELLRHDKEILPLQLINWKAERLVHHIVKPLAGTQLLSPRKTYVLVGLTRDFGQSLCTLLVEQGARHVVLCSRHPPTTPPVWQTEMLRRGVIVRFETLDVTNLEQVASLKTRLAAAGLPPVGGVVNGAMVLEDGVFASMSPDSFQRVMRPKTVGSANLDAVFDDKDLDFFIMTSSFAAIGGHAGQANYAAANMYMNGLAAARRRRGLPGSVLNIGVIYGLGFLHREKDDLYQGLEREGYPPISERDLHHMFVEAIVAGRPLKDYDGEEGQVYDITTGLRRFDGNNRTLHWHKDPRFSHFTVREHGNTVSGDATTQEEQQLYGGSGSNIPIRELIDRASTYEELMAVLVPAVAERVRYLLQLPEGAVTGEHTVSELGGDSLAAVELRSWVWHRLGRDVSVIRIMGGATVRAVAEELAAGVLTSRRETEGVAERKEVVQNKEEHQGFKTDVTEKVEVVVDAKVASGSTEPESPVSARSAGVTDSSMVSDLTLASSSGIHTKKAEK